MALRLGGKAAFISSRAAAVAATESLQLSHRPLSFSYVEGPKNPPLEHRTLPVYFREEILGKHAERQALVCRHEQPRAHGGPLSLNMGVNTHLAWDFQEFDRHINAVARGLISIGVKKGDRVAVIMGNNSSYALLQWACASVGAVLVTLNPAYRVNELANTLNLAGVSHLFVVPRLRSSRYIRMLSDAFPDLRYSSPGNIQAEAFPALRNLVVVDNIGDLNEYQKEVIDIKSVIDWREALVWREDGSEQHCINELIDSHQSDEVINLQFTSGTTGAPKAASLTHSNILNNGLGNGRCMHLTSDDVLCKYFSLATLQAMFLPYSIVLISILCLMPLPPTRLVLGNLAAWSHGACIVYPSETFDPKDIVDAVVQERCTALHGVPTHFLGVLAEVKKRREAGEKLDLSCLRTGIAAGSPIPIDLMRQLIDKLNLVDLTVAYGMSEWSHPVSFQTTPADQVTKRVETVGKVQPHVRAKIINSEGKIVPVGTPGELCVTGYLLQKGYWEDEEQTKKVMRQDPEDVSTVWMHTGDEGILDDEGYLRIVGRIKDIIIRGGENLFPVQIENVLTAHPSIREAAAISVPDVKYGEVVGAWILLEPGATMSKEEVRQVVSNNMNPQAWYAFNAPSWVWFIGEGGSAQELPKTASGKVMKHILRDWSSKLAESDVGMVVL
ncbi:acetyl-CoA synthetase-like protein [Gyrodon lividus]|nr:acetyl-CoA synthetase-like protein [Gyrodon lividus]